jgi:RNA-binding protein Musashi
MRDSATGRSRGFGFLTFKDPKTVNTVMVKEHFLDGKIVRATRYDDSSEGQEALGSLRSIRRRKRRGLHYDSQIDPKRAIPRDEQEKTAKIFVGGVSQDATEEDFEGFFAQFGRVIDATLMMDKDTGRPRGFGFVTFDSDMAVEKCLQYQPLEILGKPIEVKRAQPRGKMEEEQDFGRSRGGRGGRFGRENDRFGNDNQSGQNQQGQNSNMMGANSNGMTPQMMAQYWQRMQQYFSMMQQQMAANMMGGMGNMGNMGMNPQMMAQMQMMQQQQQKMQGGNSPNPGNGQMTPQMMQQMMNMQQQGGMNGMNMGGQQPPMGPANMGSGQQFTAQQQQAFEQRKYEQQTRRGGFGHGRGGFQNQQGIQGHGGGPQSWEGMYDDVPQPEGNGGGRGSAGPVRNNTPKPPKGPGGNAPAGAPSAPAGAPTGPKNPGKQGGGFRGGRGGGRYHPYGR